MGKNRRLARKALSVDIHPKTSENRYHVVWYDETGKRRFASRGSMAEAKKLQAEKIEELRRHREGRFNLDDREMLSQARALAASHGYTVLQAIQEWHRWKGSSKAMTLGEVIEKFLAADYLRSRHFDCCWLVAASLTARTCSQQHRYEGGGFDPA